MNDSNLPEIECVAICNSGDQKSFAVMTPLVPAQLSHRDGAGWGKVEPYQKTEVGCAWSPSHLFINFHCEDSDIWSTFLNRDDPLYEEEVVEIFLCPTGDVRDYFEIEVSPRSVVFDAKVFSPDLDRRTMIVDTGWDCDGLETEVFVNGRADVNLPAERGIVGGLWTAGMSIPFAGLGAEAPNPGDVWRVNFYRIDRPVAPAPAEFSAWSPTGENPANFHVPLRFGRLVFKE